MWERFISRIILRFNGYCPTHGVKLEVAGGPGGLGRRCNRCVRNAEAFNEAVIGRAKSTLGLK